MLRQYAVEIDVVEAVGIPTQKRYFHISIRDLTGYPPIRTASCRKFSRLDYGQASLRAPQGALSESLRPPA